MRCRGARSLVVAFSVVLFGAESLELRGFAAELLLPPLDREPDFPVCGLPELARRPLLAPVSPRSSSFSPAKPSRVRAEPGS